MWFCVTTRSPADTLGAAFPPNFAAGRACAEAKFFVSPDQNCTIIAGIALAGDQMPRSFTFETDSPRGAMVRL